MERGREGDLPRIHEFITNFTKGKEIFFILFHELERISLRETTELEKKHGIGKRIFYCFNYTKEITKEREIYHEFSNNGE
jgi:hypothetical protein